MTAKQVSFKVGQINCWVLLDGIDMIGRERFLQRFPEASEADYRQAYADIGLNFDEADSTFNILLAKIGDETILVDAGEGGHPHGGHLLDSMTLAGIAPEEITLVVITHSHGDHVLGLLADDGTAVFPNARYVISAQEVTFWQNRIDSGLADHEAIVCMIQEQGLRLIELDENIIDGLCAIPLVGHTPGQIGLLLQSNDETLLHMADLLHSPMQFAHPEWSAKFDVDTRLSVPTRQKMLDYAADDNLLTLFYHLAFPGLGWVKRTEIGFAWETKET